MRTRVWRAGVLAAVFALAAASDVSFGLGSDFGGNDFAILAWADTLQINFAARCTASYAVVGDFVSLVAQAPAGCVPVCFRYDMRVTRDPGVMRLVSRSGRCPDEAARVRVARIASEASQLRDTDDIVFYETHSA
jgi:hypothetical protein